MSSKTKKTNRTKKSAAPQPRPQAGGGIWNTLGLIVVALLCAIALWGLFGGSAPESTARPIPASRTVRPVSAAVPGIAPRPAPTRSGAPWEYDAAANHHWDPRPGHEHWHQGQPPPEDQRNVSTPTLTPVTTSPLQVTPSDGRPERTGTPWEYDAETGFHWNPLPGHEHWHRGDAPPEDQRQ